MQAGLRDVVALPISLESFESSVRAAAQWSRTMRDRVAGEESAGAALGGQLVAVAGSKGGVGTTTTALHLGLAAARMAPGRPICLVDFDLQKGDFRALLDTPHRRSVVDLVEVAHEISVRHLQETLYTHKEGFRLLLAPEEGERAEDVDSAVARNVLAAVKARHALTIVDIGAVATEATAIAAEMASLVLVVTTPDVLALRGVRRMRDLWKRLSVREDEDVADRAQPRVAAARDPARPGAQGRRRHDGPDDHPGRLQRARGRGQHGLAEPAGGQQAARRLRGAWPPSWTSSRSAEEPAPRDDEPRGLLARLGGERGQTHGRVHGPAAGRAGVILALWQIALTGVTYIARRPRRQRGRAPARRRLLRRRARRPALPRGGARRTSRTAWRSDAEIHKRGDVTVSVRLKVPFLIPALKSPLEIGTTADTVASRTSRSPTARRTDR